MAVTRLDGNDYDAKMAGADLSDKVGYCAKLDANGELVLCGANERAYGIITEDGADGDPITVAYRGLVKAIAGGAIDEGALVTSDANGKTVAGSTQSYGIARSAVTAENEWVEVLIERTA